MNSLSLRYKIVYFPSAFEKNLLKFILLSDLQALAKHKKREKERRKKINFELLFAWIRKASSKRKSFCSQESTSDIPSGWIEKLNLSQIEIDLSAVLAFLFRLSSHFSQSISITVLLELWTQSLNEKLFNNNWTKWCLFDDKEERDLNRFTSCWLDSQSFPLMMSTFSPRISPQSFFHWKSFPSVAHYQNARHPANTWKR